MIFHINLMQSIRHIDCILAMHCLFPWESCYEGLEFEADQNLRVVDLDGKRAMFMRGFDTPILSTTAASFFPLVANYHLDHHSELKTLLAALGLRGTPVGGKIQFEAIDRDTTDETLSERVYDLDALWILLRRLQHGSPSDQELADSAATLLKFARDWRQVLTEENGGPTIKVGPKRAALEAKAKEFTAWGVLGLEGLTLNEDYRGSAVAYHFRGARNFEVYGNTYQWAVTAPVDLNAKPVPSNLKKYAVPSTKVEADVLGVLQGLDIKGNEVRIGAQLSTKLYSKVNELLSHIGGKWSVSRKAHIFDDDPISSLMDIYRNGTVQTIKDYEWFQTQEREASRVIAEADIRPGMKVLEPSAGDGALASKVAAIVGHSNVVVYELMPRNLRLLQKLGFQAKELTDFLSVEPTPVFDRVVMNPPFSGGRDVAHILHAYKFLKPNGKLVAIASTQWQTHDTKPSRAFKSFLEERNARVRSIAAGAFHAAGTDVPTTMITLDKTGEVEVLTPVPSESSQAEVQQLAFF